MFERLVERWHETNQAVQEKGLKQIAYLSLEFLIAQELENALISTGLLEECRLALAEHGVALDDLLALEPSQALGNGGLGRLAACFLDSTASLGLPCMGYGIRYEYGMFRQDIVEGWQVERPDLWLDQPYPWEILRPERSYRVRFGGRVEHRANRAHWLDTDDIYAVAYDHLVPGHGHAAVNTLRLWGAKPINAFDIAMATTRGGPGTATLVLNLAMQQQWNRGFYGTASALGLTVTLIVVLTAVPLVAYLRSREVAQ